MEALIPPPQEAMTVARERMRLLALAFYISGAIGAVFASFFLIYAIMLGAISCIPDAQWAKSSPSISKSPPAEMSAVPPPHRAETSSPPPMIFFRIFAGVMGGIVILSWLFSGLTIYAGYCIQKRKNLLLVYLMAAFNCIWFPYGTILGVSAFLVLVSEPARSLFKADSEVALRP